MMTAEAASSPVLLDLRPVLDEVLGQAAISERELVAAIEGAVAQAHHRLHPDAGDDEAVRARFSIADGGLWLERVGGAEARPAMELTPLEQRQAALAVRSAIASLLRDAERNRVLSAGRNRSGELADAIVERADREMWWLRLDGLPAMLPPEEQIEGETLERNHHVKVLVLDSRRRATDAVLVVSRSHPGLLRRLLEQEVPELAAGRVGVRALVREPGRRSKVAVEALAPGVDPEGACIGPRGVRIRAVVAELGEEQVQVVGWSDDPAVLIARALGPASVSAVELDDESRTARVSVPGNQLSLAIGRAGENARLAARLCRWRIDIVAEEGRL